MVYGEEKVRQMARSILPSRARKRAKSELQAVHRKNRREVRAVLRNPGEDLPESFDPRQDVQHKISYIVGERRDADKLNHFEEWAVTVTRGLSEPDARWTKMRALLPKGVIGDHAMTHLRNYDEFRRNPFEYGSNPYLKTQTPEERAQAEKLRLENLHEKRRRLLESVLRSGSGLQALNKALRAGHVTVTWPVWHSAVPLTQMNGDGKWVTSYHGMNVETPQGPRVPRLLRGLWDLDAFLRDLGAASRSPSSIKVAPYLNREIRPCKRYYWPTRRDSGATYVYEAVRDTRRNPRHHPEWLKAVWAFLESWEG